MADEQPKVHGFVYSVEPDDRLTAFLYLLMREHLPTGTVAHLIRELPDGDESFAYTAPELAALAARYAERIMPSGDRPPGETEDEEANDVAQIEPIQGERDSLHPQGAPGEPLPKHMVAFCDLFDDRILHLPTFVDAVNEAAEAGRPADEKTAQLVGVRARELAETRREV